VVAGRGDRVVLRAGRTVGGGTVLDPAPPRGLDPARLELLARDDPASILRALVHAPVTSGKLQARGLLPPAELEAGLATLQSAGGYAFSADWLEELRTRVRQRLVARAESSPLDPGLPLGELLPAEPWAPHVLGLLDVESRGGKAFLPGGAATLGDRSEVAAALEVELAQSGAVKVEDRDLAAFLEAEGRLKRLGDGVAVSPELYERGVEAIRALTPITIASFRDALGISRKNAQLLLERYDADGLTRRVGDERVLRRAGREA
jgi:selenocysteine-specific elongation factor